jgi:hypothetical protein
MTEPEPIYARERSSLRRELLAIFVLYAAGIVLPLLIGFAFGPQSP